MNTEHLLDRPMPFIIWTLQRTGGTNFATNLVELSGLSSTEHEPFNAGRMYGHITEKWKESQDRNALDAAMDQVVQAKQILKHCVETVPWEISESLALSSLKLGYRHVFLYRRNAKDRLLSLHFAQKTGIWGPDMKAFKQFTGAKEVDPNAEHVEGEAFADVLPIEKLLNHEKRCVNVLSRAWNLLCASGASPIPIAYEDIYCANGLDKQMETLLPVLKGLGLSRNQTMDRDWVIALLSGGEQGTKDKYRLFPGVEELTNRLASISPFSPVKGVPIQCTVLNNSHPWILRFFIDVFPSQALAEQEFEVGGVLVLSREAPDGLQMKMVAKDVCISLKWDIPSPRMAKEHAIGKNASRARWTGKASFTDEYQNFEIKLISKDGHELTIGEISPKTQMSEELLED